jgi:ABC-type lipoprotein export system ATPase subunit
MTNVASTTLPTEGQVNASSILRAVNVRKTYIIGKRTLEVLRGVSLEVRRGEFLALRGASGAGKSTLLHLLGGLDKPNAGEVLFEEIALHTLSSSDLARLRTQRVGLIFQAYHLFPELNALENVCLPGRMSRVSLSKLEEKGKELLALVGLKDRLYHRPYELSGGEQQRVALARSLINDPHLILADEPTGNLDSHTGDEIIDLLCSIKNERNTTLVIATHDNKVAERAERSITLVDGQISTPAA